MILLSEKKKRFPFYFYLILFSLPVIFFVLLEISLRILEYGYNNEQWIEVSKGKLILNTEIARRYFYKTNTLPYSNQEVFDKIKKENSFRVFVLGESSAQGFPFAPLGSFSRYLQQRLELVYPESKIEVVNLGITAVNSYTIRDLICGVLEQSPDLIIIYTGHNEYYGALGVGSMESLGTSRDIISAALYMQRFKTFELLTDLVKSISRWLSSSQITNQDETLMERMVKEQYIPLESGIYWDGILQFKENLRDVLEEAKQKNVRILLSTLTSNTKDQKPFVSIKTNNHPSADNIYKIAKESLKNNEIRTADSLFDFAKELDALRFRAPQKINEIIKEFGTEYSFPVVDIDSVFRSTSPLGIVGDNLMTDHLHPTLEGYQLMGKAFFDKMKFLGYLPKSKKINLPDKQQDSITKKNFIFSELDSIQAHYRITALKNDWPFITKEQKVPVYDLLKPKNYIDSLAYESTIGDMNWELLHRKAADWYLNKGDIKNYKEQMDILISQFPVTFDYNNSVALELIKLGQYDAAYPYLTRRYALEPDAFSCKWIGIIDLSESRNESAVKFLKESRRFDQIDSQVLFNLAGAYSRLKDFRKALEIANECLEIDPDYTAARNLITQLESAIIKSE